MIPLARKEPLDERSLHEKWMRSVTRIPFRSGDKVIVAVSGGADSVCLLHLLRSLSTRRPLSLHVAHLNHGLRPEAREEARFVEDLSKTWGIPMSSSERSVLQFCKARHLSKQEGARAVRYQFLKEVAKDAGARWIALGHTADDQAETFLMRLLRGAGMRGLKGIPKMREGSIIRPLLEIRRNEILEELSRGKIPYIEDPSNRQPVYLRNRIRHALLPLLEQYNPNVKEAFCREAELLREEDDFIEQYLSEILSGLVIERDRRRVVFDISALQSLHPALQRRALRWGVDQIHPGLRGIGFYHIETILTRITPGPTGHTYTLPHNMIVEKRYSRLLLKRARAPDKKGGVPHSNGRSEINHAQTEVPLPQMRSQPVKAVVVLHDWGLRMKISLHQGPFLSFSPCVASFDFDKIILPLSIRRWRPGDRFIPRGMKGRRKKLQDFFVDTKIEKSERNRRPLLICSKGILWVIGLRMDERFQATNQTKRTLIVEVEGKLQEEKSGLSGEHR
ncbi:MAG: tRNA lysidine(34) synthetase TilS [Nitrospiria bacterium]